MKFTPLIIVFAVMCLLRADARENSPNTEEAERLFTNFEKNVFIEDETTIVAMGWTMWSDGKRLHKSYLERQALEVAKLGIDAYATAVMYLDHKEPYMRFIAARSLQRITGVGETWYWFGTPGEKFGSDLDWSDRAKKEWNAWYIAARKNQAEQAGADQPATAPQSKPTDDTTPNHESKPRPQ